MASSTAVFNGTVGLLPPRQQAAAAGGYYTITNPTPGTGIVCGTVTAFSATADGLITISNSGARTIYLDALSLMMSGTAPTATTVQKIAVYLENGTVAPSAGSSVVSAKPLNPTAGGGSGATCNVFAAGMATIPAAVGTRTLVSNGSLPTSLGITGDTYVYIFGGDPSVTGGASTAVRATAPARLVTTCNAVTIPPGFTAIIDWWWIGQATNGPTFEYELGWFEF
jgi:hypothetical protein